MRYQLSKINANTAGLATFPSDQYDLHLDYGRAAFDMRHRFFLGGFTRLRWGFGINPFFVYQSSSPFNIVVGQDLNGDTQFNDRPHLRPTCRGPAWSTPHGALSTLNPSRARRSFRSTTGKAPAWSCSTCAWCGDSTSDPSCPIRSRRTAQTRLRLLPRPRRTKPPSR